MPPISKLETMARAGVDLSEHVKEWRAAKCGSKEEASLLKRLSICFKTAYRILGPKTKRQRERDIRVKRSVAGTCKGDGNYTKRRKAELALARSKWDGIVAERKEAERAGRDLYRGEMYPEGAPLRAVGF